MVTVRRTPVTGGLFVSGRAVPMQPATPVPKVLKASRLSAAEPAALALILALHTLALGVMLWSETDFWSRTTFLLTWVFFNCAWLAILRRPAVAALLSLAMIALVIVLSRFKFDTLYMTADFVDLMLLDEATLTFLLMIVPGLDVWVTLAVAVAALALAVAWRLDAFRVRVHTASLGCAVSLAALSGLSYAVPHDIDDKWLNQDHVSKFARSAAVAVSEYFSRGVLLSDAAVTAELKSIATVPCVPPPRAPHIVMILDESSFDARLVPGTKVPTDYGRHFRSFDGKTRTFLTEGAGGPTWFTEYNVLTGLSSRSFGRFADALTRFAAGRVERGLPQTLSRCGYRTFSLYPWYGNFLGARGFQTSSGIENFLDAKYLGSLGNEADSFYFDAARRLIAEERKRGPMFVFVYTMANHFPWNYRFRPELLPDWKDPGNAPELDEYLRRQAMSERDYRLFRVQLEREFPREPFLIIRFGDHQPLFAKHVIDPTLDAAGIARRIAALDPRFFLTYYAIDTIQFRPADVSSAIERLDAPYLPLVTLEAAGIPLDASFAEQKRIFQRCKGLFFQCADGAEASRFNRLLIDAGLIKGL